MVVTRSRLHAVRYKEAIDAYIAKKGYDRGEGRIATLVAFSGTVVDPDHQTVSYTESLMNGFPESRLPKRFADEYQVLVVAEKYQTGYDQPLLHSMYVDKKLAGVRAVQTLSQLNRIYPEKSDTFVLDFANSEDEIQDAFRPFYSESSAAPTDPNVLYELQRTLENAQVIHPDEQARAVSLLLANRRVDQGAIYACLTPAVSRFATLEPDERKEFRDTVNSFVRAYAFLAQVMSWTDRGLESLYLYGRALLAMLPAAEDDPLPQISDSVLLTHLRTEAQGEEAVLFLTSGSDEPGVALPGGGAGREYESPHGRLSELIDQLNDRYGMNLTDADKVWFEQQKIALVEDKTVRLVAMSNDRDQFRVMLEKFAESAIIDRHDSNGALFEAFFAKPGFREALMTYLSSSYDEIRTSNQRG